MKKLLLLFLIFLLNGSAFAKVNYEYDKFKDSTGLTTDRIYGGWGNSIYAYATASFEGSSPKKLIDWVLLVVYTDENYPRFHHDDKMIILADGNRIAPERSQPDWKAYYAAIKLEDFRRMANSESVEAQIGGFEFRFTPKMVADYRLLLGKIDEIQPKLGEGTN